MVSPCLLYYPCLFQCPCLFCCPCLTFFPCLFSFPCLFLAPVASLSATIDPPPATPIPSERADLSPERTVHAPTYTSFPSDFETQVEQSSDDEGSEHSSACQPRDEQGARSDHSSPFFDARPSPPYNPTYDNTASPPSPAYDPANYEPATPTSPAYNPDDDRKRSAADSDSSVEIVSPPKKRYISLAERNPSFMVRELVSIVNEYRDDLQARIPVEDADIKQQLSEAFDRIIEESKRVTGRLNMRTHSYELFRHPKNDFIQVWPQGKAAVTTRLRADGLIFDPELNQPLNHLFAHPLLDEYEHPPLSGKFFARLRIPTKLTSIQLRDEPGQPKPLCTQVNDFVVSLDPFAVFRLVAKDAHFRSFRQPKYGYSLGKPVDTNLSENTIHQWTFGTDAAIAERVVDLAEGTPRKSRKSIKRHRK